MSDELEIRRRMSRYRQLRLTATLETTGRMSYSVYAKPLNLAWNEQHLIVRDSVPGFSPLATPDDVIRAVVALLQEQMLPGID